MTEETARLDYSKPPQGYEVARLNVGAHIPPIMPWAWCILEQSGRWEEDGGFADEPAAVAASWAHYKARNDPPSLRVLVGLGCDIVGMRVAAWAWHDRRHALVARLEDEGVQVDMWPHALVWTDSECLECERWPGMRALPDDFPAVLRSLAEMPEVLRG